MSLDSNHNVIASASGRFDEQGGKLHCPQTGVSVLIPAQALNEPTEIYFKVCQDANLLPPLDSTKGETLLSPIVMCGPHGLRFKRPVELRLPHRANVDPDSWTFALKSSDATQSESAPFIRI